MQFIRRILSKVGIYWRTEMDDVRGLDSRMLEFLNDFFENPKGLKGAELTNHLNQMAKHLIKITAHPEGRDLIFNPPSDREDSPEGVIREIKRWRQSQGLPLFKDS